MMRSADDLVGARRAALLKLSRLVVLLADVILKTQNHMMKA